MVHRVSAHVYGAQKEDLAGPGARLDRFGLQPLPKALPPPAAMDKPSLLDDLQARLARVIQDTPAADLQRTLRAVLEQGLQRLDLVTREDLDTYVQWAATMRQRVTQLEARIETLERERSAAGEAPGTAPLP